MSLYARTDTEKPAIRTHRHDVVVGVFTIATRPVDVATPLQTDVFWTTRITISNYSTIGEKLPHLRVLLPFATQDHVQAAPDKPHIRQAYDGFHNTVGL